MTMSAAETRSAARLRVLVKEVQEIKEMVAGGKPVPEFYLPVDPEWVSENPTDAARRITRLSEALMRAIAHCDTAKHKDKKYRNERAAIVDALGPKALVTEELHMNDYRSPGELWLRFAVGVFVAVGAAGGIVYLVRLI